MTDFIEGESRSQTTLFPESLYAEQSGKPF